MEAVQMSLPGFTTRLGDWMQTVSGKAVWPLDPRPEEIDLEDIAHALSMQCRYAGHCRKFYSVAEHSVLLSRAMPTVELKRWALLHDATEAYLVDLPRPVKRNMPYYAVAEEYLMAAIAERFGLSGEMPPEVKDADNRILVDEMRQLMRTPPMAWDIPDEPLGVSIGGWYPTVACELFLRDARLLGIH